MSGCISCRGSDPIIVILNQNLEEGAEGLTARESEVNSRSLILYNDRRCKT